MPVTELNFSDTSTVTIQAREAVTGEDYARPIWSATISKPQITIRTGTLNNAAGGGDEVLSQVYTIAASGTQSIDLQNFTNFTGEASSSFARVKYVKIRLLSVADDATNGTACTGVEVAPHATNGWTSLIKAAGDTIIIGNGDDFTFKTTRAAGLTVGASNKVIQITNLDSVVAAKVQVTIVGGST